MELVHEIVEMEAELSVWRRNIHAHPELGFAENRTSDFVAEKLTEFGIQVHRGIGKTGLVGVLREGNETNSIGLRADMDALPIHEKNQFDHCSKSEGTMHACGHDGHTVMLLAAAKYLAETRNFQGQVNFIFQPAEEGLGGARAMIKDGLFEKFPCDRIYAMHNGPGLPVGKFSAVPGVRTAAGAFFDIDIKGKGGHGAFPHLAIDPIPIAAEVVSALQTLISRSTAPNESVVLSVTKIHAGDAYNVIPDSARLSGTIRTFSMEKMKELESHLNALSQGIASAHGASANLIFEVPFHPVVNDEPATNFAAGICNDLVGENNVYRTGDPGTGSEDFSFMTEQVPGCYLVIGNGEQSNALHNPNYDFNDEALVFGGSFFARVTESELAVDRVR
jgi:hippurate hydrolase|tara:strand:- start:3821 stop:4993 length:1173 start_codon:yes stop_codon:yes gene_type:complete